MAELAIQSQITFLYYRDLEPAARFYGEILGLEPVVDQGWARIYRVAGGAYLGIVTGERGYHAAQERSAVLVTLVVEDAAAWHEALQRRGVVPASGPETGVETREELGIRRFFVTDPGGYALEVQEFLDPDQAEAFRG